MIIIFTYQREQNLSRILDELEGVDEIVVIDDGSNYPQTPFVQRCRYIRLPHNGREQWWQNWDHAFRICKHSKHDRFVFMPDDWKEIDTDRIYAAFDDLPDPFACNVTNVGWQRSWTPRRKNPSGIDGYFSVGWIDHGLITTRKTLGILGWNMYAVNRSHFRANNSSGVGKQLSNRFYKAGVPMFTPYKSMAVHQGCESVMHPERIHDLRPQ